MSSIHFPHASDLVNERVQAFMNTLHQCDEIHAEGKEERAEIQEGQQ